MPQEKAIVINQLVRIDYGKDFPFAAPLISFLPQEGADTLSLFDLGALTFRDIMKEEYHPSLHFAEIGERSIAFYEKNVTKATGLLSYIMVKSSQQVLLCCLIALFNLGLILIGTWLESQ